MALQLQMSWQPSLLSQKRKNGPPIGLRNLGNSCYLNSVLQCLTYTPPLANFCLKCQHSSLCDLTRDCPFCILEKRIVRSLSVDQTSDAPLKIQSCLRIFAEHFRCGRQEDAHEFLRYVIDACHNACLRLKKLQLRRSNSKGGEQSTSTATGATTTVVKEIFGGALQSQVKCLSCGNESNKDDEIMDISLDVLLSNSLKEALHKFFQPEVLDDNNKYKCDKCKKLVVARKQMSILQAPNVLVIQLKRFEGILGAKIDKAIAFEEVLVLSSFMCKASRIQDPLPEYKLFGTIVHSGYSQDSGHYYAYIKDAMGRWYCCDDSFVSLSTLQEVLSEKVYILFFSRTNQRPTSASTVFTSNGIKSSDCNGSEAFKSPKAIPLKEAHTKAYVEQSSQKDMSNISRVVKVPFSPKMRFSIGNSTSKRTPATGIVNDELPKSQPMETNGYAKDSIPKEKSEKVVALTINGNGFNRIRTFDAADNKHGTGFPSTGENGNSQSSINLGKSDLGDCNGTRTGVMKGGPNHPELGTSRVNGGAETHKTNGGFEILGSKRKSKESGGIFSPQHAQSQEEYEELKENLKQEASSFLRSCGWSEEVYKFMNTTKKQCREAGNYPSSSCEFKKTLIADAKPTFISQIPESLKEDLIGRLRSFNQGKKLFSRTLIN